MLKQSYKYNTRHKLSESEVFNRWTMAHWWATASFLGGPHIDGVKKSLNQFRMKVFVNKEKVAEIRCGIKVKTLF